MIDHAATIRYVPRVRVVPASVIAALAFAVTVATPRTASAGRTYYGWLYGTEVMPERGVELQTWLLERDNVGDDHVKETSLWWGPLIGITDHLELALPVELDWTESDLDKPDFTLKRIGVEGRYRFVDSEAAFAPLARIAVKRDVTIRDATIVEADAVASYQKGRFHGLVDLGIVSEITPDRTVTEIRPGAGVSIQAVGDLRFGAELYGEIGVGDDDERWLAIGPNMAWTHGRFWLSAALGIGVMNISAAPRIMWGVSF
jgi:hypothetical protein